MNCTFSWNHQCHPMLKNMDRKYSLRHHFWLEKPTTNQKQLNLLYQQLMRSLPLFQLKISEVSLNSLLNLAKLKAPIPVCQLIELQLLMLFFNS